MATVTEPRFNDNGEVKGCSDCPLEDNDDLCAIYIRHHNVMCPTVEDYEGVAKQVEESRTDRLDSFHEAEKEAQR